MIWNSNDKIYFYKIWWIKIIMSPQMGINKKQGQSYVITDQTAILLKVV